jgi:glycosyltransferase involved in cell wall biosynthesis
MPKVSVVIPAYNAMTYLPETVESVLRQSFTDFEVLIIDDGSSDQIGQWFSQLMEPRVKLISQPNQGVAVARNNGIAHAQGEYIAFLDADDLWEPTKLEKQVDCLDHHPAVGLVYTWILLVDRQGNPTGRIFTSDAEGDVWEQIVVDNMIPNGSATMIRRSCFETVGVFDPNLPPAEDWDMWIRIAARYSFAVVKEPLVYYRKYANSASKNRQLMIEKISAVIEKTFASTPLQLLYLRNRSYGYMHLYQAWNSIDENDYKGAILFQRQALLHYPQLLFSQSFLRLILAIALTRWLGANGYDGVRSLTHSLRQRLLGITGFTLSKSNN